MRGRKQMATELLEWGARLDAKTYLNNTALHLAGPSLLFPLSL
jgi:ankyrin repeat protein